jgi:hypothetical protein
MDEEEVTPEPTPKWVLEADRAHKRYEIARDVLAAMIAGEKYVHEARGVAAQAGVTEDDVLAGWAVTQADALLTALTPEAR